MAQFTLTPLQGISLAQRAGVRPLLDQSNRKRPLRLDRRLVEASPRQRLLALSVQRVK